MPLISHEPIATAPTAANLPPFAVRQCEESLSVFFGIKLRKLGQSCSRDFKRRPDRTGKDFPVLNSDVVSCPWFRSNVLVSLKFGQDRTGQEKTFWC